MRSSIKINIYYFLFKSYFKNFCWIVFFSTFINGITPILQRLIFLTVIVIGVRIILDKTQTEVENDIFLIFDSYSLFIFLSLLVGMPAVDLFKIKLTRIADLKWKEVAKFSTTPKIKLIKKYVSSMLGLVFQILAGFTVILIFGNLNIALILLLSIVVISLYRKYFFYIPLTPKFLKRTYLIESFSVYLGLSVFLFSLVLYYAIFPSEQLDIIYFFVICIFPRAMMITVNRASKLHQTIIKDKKISVEIFRKLESLYEKK